MVFLVAITVLILSLISLDGETDSSDDEIIIEEHNVEKVEVSKSGGGDQGRNGKVLIRSSLEGSLDGSQQNVVGQQKGKNLPHLVKLP